MNLTLADTFTDAPKYKIIIQQAEADLDGVFIWLDVTSKSLKNFAHSLNAQVQAQRHLSKHLQPVQQLLDKNPLTTLNESLQCSIPFTAKFIDDVDEIIAAIVAFKNSSEFKEQRRLFAKAESSYDSYLKWFLALSKAKEASSVREDAFQLHDVRVSYIKQSFRYSQYLINLKYELDSLAYQCLTMVTSLQEYFDNLQMVNKGFMNKVQVLQTQFKLTQSQRKQEIDNLDVQRESLEQQMIEQHQPSSQLPVTGVQKPEVEAELRDKSGYLMRRTGKGVWLRRFAEVKSGSLVLSAIYGNKIAMSSSYNLSICNVKVSEAHDRRFVFELLSHKQALILQAEDEDDFLEWMEVIEACRLHGSFEEQDFGQVAELTDEEFTQFVEVPLLVNTREEVLLQTSDSFKFPSVLLQKKNAEFHNIIKSIPEDEFLMESYAAQYQDKDDLIQGRLYLTPKNVCFNSNSQSGITTILIPVAKISKVKNDQGLRITVVHQDTSLMHTFFVQDVEIVRGALELIRSKKLSSQDLVDTIHELYMLPEERRSSSPTRMVTMAPSWPNDAPSPPQSEVQCSCSDHNEKEEVNIVLKVPAHVLFDKMFQSIQIFENTHKKRSEWDIKFSEWSEVDGYQQRNVSWMFNVNQAMVSVKQTDCQEVQIITKKDPYLCYVVDVSSKTVNLPYGDSFQTETRYCITFVSPTSCRLRCTIGLTWFKQPFVKNIIKNAALAGLAGFMKDLMPVLQSEIGTQFEFDIQSKEPQSKSQKPIIQEPSSIPWKAIFGIAFLLLAAILYLILPVKVGQKLTWLTDPTVSGVYYEDVYQQLLNTSGLLSKSQRQLIQRDTFRYFLQSNQHVWYEFERESVHLGKTQKYTQRLRKQLLQSVDIVNGMEAHLIEQQYVIWMRDNINRCLAVLSQSNEPALYKACKSLQMDLKSFLVSRLK